MGDTALPVVLGSSATSRRAILHAAGLAFTCISPDIDEKGVRSLDPLKLPALVANAKADALLSKLTQGGVVLITADQIVLGPDGGVREKPETDEEAAAFVSSYAGASARTVSAIVVTNTSTGARATGVHVAEVLMSAGLSADVARVLTPGFPVPLPSLHAKVMHAGGQGADDGLTFGSLASHGRLSSDPTGGSAGLVDVRHCAGALCIEHPCVAPHVTGIKMVSVTGCEGADAVAAYTCGVDAVHGLPWALTRHLVSLVAPGHPLAL